MWLLLLELPLQLVVEPGADYVDVPRAQLEVLAAGHLVRGQPAAGLTAQRAQVRLHLLVVEAGLQTLGDLLAAKVHHQSCFLLYHEQAPVNIIFISAASAKNITRLT